MDGAVWLVTGAQASGKSTVADLLARRFERGVHVRGHQFARWIVSGAAAFDDADRVLEARRQLDLRYRLSSQAAATYAAAGFTAVVQDNIYGDDVVTWLAVAGAAAPAHLVVLRPAVGVVAARDDARRRATGKVAYRGAFTPTENDRHLATTPPIGLWLDTSEQSADETVAEILRRRDEAAVSPSPAPPP
jgi:hypothetical protein